MQGAFIFLMFVFGAVFGSFLCCQARRLHQKASKKSPLGKRSVCLHCKKQLKWYENLPLISWLLQKGKCRSCHARIGLAEFLSELLMALTFTGLATTIDITTATAAEWSVFAAMILFVLCLGFLAIYDGLYGELPNFMLYITIAVALGVFLVAYFTGALAGANLSPVLGVATSVAILGGLYLLLYLISSGKWVGDGDWLLGVAIGLVLADPWLALIELFLANTIACLVMLPSVKSKKQKKIYFGPFLAIACAITITFSDLFKSMIL